MDIWTEKLEPRHIYALKRWIGRSSGVLTSNDFPNNEDDLHNWLEWRSDPGRLDCLVLAYETPVGLGGFRQRDKLQKVEFYLLLGEVGYNPIRIATYATQRILARAFTDYSRDEMIARVYSSHEDYIEVLSKMGFSKIAEESELTILAIKKSQFMDSKYLF